MKPPDSAAHQILMKHHKVGFELLIVLQIDVSQKLFNLLYSLFVLLFP